MLSTRTDVRCHSHDKFWQADWYFSITEYRELLQPLGGFVLHSATHINLWMTCLKNKFKLKKKKKNIIWLHMLLIHNTNCKSSSWRKIQHKNISTYQHMALPGGGELNWREDKDVQDCWRSEAHMKRYTNMITLGLTLGINDSKDDVSKKKLWCLH